MGNLNRLEMVNELTPNKPQEFSYEDLKIFTNEFKDEIGSGKFGVVYKGEFSNGMKIAVKVLKEKYVTKELFIEELRIMSMIDHPNLVKLYGFCFDSNIKGLVYEYLENGSLHKVLCEKNLRLRVGWDKLYDIMIQTAIAITHLHDGHVCIIHYDIKPANILLTSSFSPKIGDFGLAKLTNKDDSHVSLLQATGTRGYMAPEMWMSFSRATRKCDVYSFGMTLFDILGMCSIDENGEWFLRIVWERFQQGQLDKIIENCGIEEKDRESAKLLSVIAFWCAQYTPNARPPMRDVVKMLKRELQVMTPPNPTLVAPDYTPNTSREMQANEDIEISKPPKDTTDDAVNIFIKYLSKDAGASPHKPVAAIIIYKCLLHSNSFRDKQAIIFNSLVEMIDSTIANRRGNYSLAYWLSNTSMLLLFLSHGFKGKRATRQKSGSLPSHFKQQVTAYVEKISRVIRNQMKEELISLLSRLTTAKVSYESSNNLSRKTQWQNLIAILNKYLKPLQKHFVPSLLIRDIFSRTFYYINVQLFNSLMLHRECCSYSNGKHLEAGLRRLELWCDQATKKCAGSSWDELHHIRGAIRFLVIHNKSTISMNDIRRICPRLYRKQFYTLCINCWDDKNDSRPVSDDVISQMTKFLGKSSKYDAKDSFSLEDKSDAPISSTELFKSLREVDFSDDTLDAERKRNPALKVLLEW